MCKRIVSLLLSLVLLLSLMPTRVLAEELEPAMEEAVLTEETVPAAPEETEVLAPEETEVPAPEETEAPEQTLEAEAPVSEAEPEAPAAEVPGGQIGDLSWKITDEGCLVISGQGKMPDFLNEDWEIETPWQDYAARITGILVEEGVTTIGQYAFYQLSNVTEISLPDSLTSLGSGFLQDCAKLESITIPAAVRGIDKDMFAGCTSLKAIHMEEGNDFLYSVDGVLYMKDNFASYIRAYPDGRADPVYTVTEDITWISMLAFARCKQLEEVILPDTLTHIGERTFMASGLKTITIPASVEMIKSSAFYGCTDLETVYFEGDAPENEGSIFGFDPYWVTATCYYPEDNATWTQEARQSFGGNITWLPYCGHGKPAYVPETKPTCTTAGNLEYWYCETCQTVWENEMLTQVVSLEDMIWPEEHAWNAGIVVKEPTCSTPGQRLLTCKRCGQETTVKLYDGDHVDEDGDQVCDECDESLVKPLGSKENPEILPLNERKQVSVDADSSYYYQLTVPEEGILTMEIGVFDTMMSAYSTGLDPDKLEAMDKGYYTPSSPSEDTVVWEVAKGEVVNIEFNVPGYGSGEGVILASFEPKQLPKGSCVHPLVVTDQEPSDPAVAQYTVTVPTGQKLYFDASAVQGSLLKGKAVEGLRYLNGSYEWDPDENGIVSIIMDWDRGTFALENTTDADITAEIVFAFEDGHEKNPRSLELGTTELNLLVYDKQGKYYTWTAPADGQFTFHVEGYVGGELWQYQIFTDGEAGPVCTAEDDPATDTTVQTVRAGQQLLIHVIGYAYAPDLVMGFSGKYLLTASFQEMEAAGPGMTAEDPILVQFAMNDAWTAGTAAVTVEPGSWYYGAYIAGMELTANGEAVEVTPPAMFGMPAVFCLTNEGAEAVTYELAVSTPVGTMGNPAELTLGENTAVIKEGNDQGYYYSWNAPVGGQLTVTMPEGDWMYTLNNLTSGIYGDTQWSDSENVAPVSVLDVSAGDEIQVIVSTYDPASPWAAPAGTVVFQASFAAASLRLVPQAEAPARVELQEDGSYSLLLNREDVAQQAFAFTVSAEGGQLLPEKLKWSTSDSRVAAVKNGTVTVKAKAEGVCVITAQDPKTGEEATLTVCVRDYAPRLESASVTLNSYRTEGVAVSLVEGYGNAIQDISLSLHEYDSKSKQYSAEPSARFWPEYSDSSLTIGHTAALKNGTYKLLLKVPCENGEVYEYKLSVKVANSLPSVTIKQLDKLNTFYKDSTARFQITAKNGQVKWAEWYSQKNPAFRSEFDPETGILTVRFSDSYLAGTTALKTKGTVEFQFEGYLVPVEKSVTVKTETVKPKLSLNESSFTVNLALDDDPSIFINVLEGEPMYGFVGSDCLEVRAPFAEVEYREDYGCNLTLTGSKGGTAYVTVRDDNWTGTVELKCTVKVENKLPTVVLEEKKLTLNSLLNDRSVWQYIELSQDNVSMEEVVLKCVNRKEADRLEAAKIQKDISGFGIHFWLDPENLPKKGTYEFQVTGYVPSSEGDSLVKLAPKTFKVVVEDKAPTVKLKSTTLKLNKKLNANGCQAMTETAVTLSGDAAEYYIKDMVVVNCDENIDVSFDPETYTIRATLLNGEVKAGKSCNVELQPVLGSIYDPEDYWSIQLPKTVKLKVQVTDAKPGVTVKASGKLDTIVPDSAITYTISKLTNIEGQPTAVRLEGKGAELFNVELADNGAIVTLNKDMPQQKGKSYSLQLVFAIAGQEVAAKVSVKVNQSNVKFASLKPVNFYQAQSSRMAVQLVMTAPEGASVEDITLGSKTANQLLSALGDDAVTFLELENGKVLVSIKVSNPGYLVYGKSYSLYLDVTPEGNAENAKPTSVKVTVKVAK